MGVWAFKIELGCAREHNERGIGLTTGLASWKHVLVRPKE